MSNTDNKYKVLSIRHLAEQAGIDQFKLYHNLHGKYNSMTDNEKTEVVNALHDSLKEFAKFMGVEINIKKLKKARA